MKNNKKGFTLIELLAVIIILGILMIIAIPSVTKYISDARKDSYLDTAKEIITGARNMVNDGKLEMFDTDTTYYIDVACIKTENGTKSPYGEFTKAYVVVTYDGKGYDYYWTSVDDAGQGIKNITKLDNLTIDSISSDLKDSDIANNYGIDGRNNYALINKANECGKGASSEVAKKVDGETGEEIVIVCKKATELHKKTCNVQSTTYACGGTVGFGSEITYGTIPSGQPKPGDAYDCKIKENGGYTERFYYVTSEGSNSILIYYSNVNGGSVSTQHVAYNANSTDSSSGPVTAAAFLPTTSQWDNSALIIPSTSIKNENGDVVIENFAGYVGKAAKMLSSQEIVAGCPGLSKVANFTRGELDGCTWLFDEIGLYEGSNDAEGYYLDTIWTGSSNATLSVFGNNRNVTGGSVQSTYRGVRPVITVRTSGLEK